MRKIVTLWVWLLGSLSLCLAQTQVSGRVTQSNTGDPMIGVSVLVSGTTTGDLTDEAGRFSLSVPDANGELVISFIGYKTQTIPLSGRRTLDISLEESDVYLDEVVVTAIGIERQKKALGYATQNISSEELNQAGNPDAIRALAGKVAGVQIGTSTGAVGGSSRIVIRGNRSFTGNNQPLFVVDGIPIDNSQFVNDGVSSTANPQVRTRDPRSQADFGNTGLDLNPEDIASINVLKGPSAAALYGSRASNGAIIITTKSGQDAARRGKTAEITFSSTFTFEELNYIPDLQQSYAGGANGDFVAVPFSAWGPRFEGQTVVNPLSNFPDQPDSVALSPFNAYEDFFERGHSWTNNLSFAGGNATTNYRLSITDLRQKGVAPNTDFKRTTITARAGSQLNDRIRSDFSITYTNSGSDNVPLGGQNRSFVRQFLWNPPNIDWNVFRDFEDSLGNSINYTTFWENPYWTLNKNTITQARNRINGFVSTQIELTNWLSVTGRVGTDFYENRREGVIAINTQGQQNGFIYRDELFVRELTSDVLLNINKGFGDFQLNAVFGHNLRQRDTRTLYGEANGIVIPEFYNFNNAQDATRTINNATQRRLVGVYGTASLGYRDFAFIEVTGRNDWSSTLPVESNSYFYPSVAGSVVLTEAIGALQDKTWMPYLKIRGNWARVGNDAQPYQLDTNFPQARAFNSLFDNLLFPFGSQAAFRVSNRLGNASLTPEFTNSWEVGAEASFLNNRLSLDFSYYETRSEGQIFAVNLAPSTGFTSQTRNAGLMTNKGYEFFMNIKPIYQEQADGFRWNIGVNFTQINNEVVELFGDLDALDVPPAGFISTQVQAKPGFPYPSLIGRAFRRSPDGDLLINPATGRVTLEDTFSVLGTAQPDFIMGITNTFSFKGFRLTALFNIQQGGKFYSLTATHLRYNGLGEETVFGRDGLVVDGVIEETDNEGNVNYRPNDIPVSGEDFWGLMNLFGSSELGLYDASFIKLREVSLSYTFPKSLLDKTPISSLELGLLGRNLWLNTSNPYIDPESNLFGSANAQGYEYAQMPSTRSYGGTLRIRF